MGEKRKIFFIALIILLAGLFIYQLENTSFKFNFSKTELTINETEIKERLTYFTDEPYHTLYRNFKNPILENPALFSDSIFIRKVFCSSGTPYFYSTNHCFLDNSNFSKMCLAYTEPNEYGCGFGTTYGFQKDKEYFIEAEYNLFPKNLIRINEEYYTKFIVYEKNNHKKLKVGKNLFITGEAKFKEKYYPDEQVIIYIPYKNNSEGFQIINKENFEFDDKSREHFFQIILCLFPAIFIIILWYFFGKENSNPNLPERLSDYPCERKAWEVACFFNSSSINSYSKLISTLFVDFYNKKIIDINYLDKELFVKIINENSLDEVEEKFISIIKLFKKNNDYFKIDEKELSPTSKKRLSSLQSSLVHKIREEEKKYLGDSEKFLTIFSLTQLAIAFGSLLLGSIWIASFLTIIMLFVLILTRTYESLFTKYKENYYEEFLRWNAFKKFLSDSYSMKSHGYKGTIIWGKILVYATALGEAKKVLEELKKKGFIDDKIYSNYNFVCHPNNFYFMNLNSNPLSTNNYSGGFSGGGFSGGGIGGGGGGGR